MADVYASIEDVRLAYEKTIPDDRAAWVTYLIGRASRRLNSLVPGIQDRIDDRSLAVEDVRDVVVGAVLRIVRNPEGLSMEMEGSYSYQTRADVAGGALMFTSDDLNQVRARQTGTVGRPFESRVPLYRRQP